MQGQHSRRSQNQMFNKKPGLITVICNRLILPSESMKILFLSILITSIATPSLARGREVFFQSIGQDEITLTPGSRLEIINCEELASGGMNCSAAIINESEAPCMPNEEPLTIW